MENTTESIKVLSVKQPFAEWILEGKKTLEIRSWKTKYRGRLYIHSCKEPYLLGFCPRPCGYILGYVDLIDTRKMIPDDAKAGWYRFIEDAYVWILSNPVQMKTIIPAKGRQRIWNYDTLGRRGFDLGQSLTKTD